MREKALAQDMFARKAYYSRLKPNNMKTIPLSQELARIVAHIAADGYLYSAKQRRTEKELLEHPRNIKTRFVYGIRYVNSEPALVKQFSQDCKIALNRKVVAKRKNEFEISGKWVYEMVSRLGAGKSREWFVSKEIFQAARLVKAAWLQALFDDEAHVSVSDRRIVLAMVNLKGLQQVQSLLSQFDIESKICGPYKNKKSIIYQLKIYSGNIKQFQKTINFSHPKKNRSLERIIKK